LRGVLTRLLRIFASSFGFSPHWTKVKYWTKVQWTGWLLFRRDIVV
jgi:hypothetical protein